MSMFNDLVQGLDDSFWSAVPSPDPSPVKQKKVLLATPCTPTKSRQPKKILSSIDDYDITTFLEGSENWDLDADPFTPIKPSSTTEKVSILYYFFEHV
jgi:DNA replication ATP-dependent helicase Dna2